MPRSREELLIRAFAYALILAAIGFALWLVKVTIGPELGFLLFIVLGITGVNKTRIGRELAYVAVHTVGVAGLNTSGRPGDDPFVGTENYPWLLQSLTALVVIVLYMWWCRARLYRK